jgi:cysteine desulfurase/selenocysteine lyase
VGMGRVEAHVRRLATRIASELAALDLPVAGGAPGPHLGHIVCVGDSGGGRHYTADDPLMNAVYEHLTAKGARLSIRSGTLRFSVAFYNNDHDVNQIVEWAAEMAKTALK